MKKNIACYYHPTTVIFVDDNRHFFSTIRTQLDADAFVPCFFDNPKEALDFLKNYPRRDSLIRRCFTSLEGEEADRHRLDMNISLIHDEIYDPKRFEHIYVIVVDYAMPGMQGDEFCRQLNHLNLKIILLTGELDEKKAVNLFNEGIIHRYIRKDERHFDVVLNDTIKILQHAYFQEASDVMVNNLIKNVDGGSCCLGDDIFVQFFNQFIQEHDITEYYLLDERGSFLCADNNGKLSWLLVRDDIDMEATRFEVDIDDESVPLEIRKAIDEKKVIRHCFTQHEYPTGIQDWPQFIYPATKLQGDTNFYYSHVKTPFVATGLDNNKIKSFNTYLEELIHRN